MAGAIGQFRNIFKLMTDSSALMPSDELFHKKEDLFLCIWCILGMCRMEDPHFYT